MIALDTNILVYALENKPDDARNLAALELIDRLGMVGAIIPFPVIGELFNACRKKQIADVAQLTPRVELWMTAMSGAPAILDDYLSAADLSQLYNVQYFDALIITVAARAGASILLSEDMHDGLEIDGLRIVNPFVAANDALLADYFANTN